MARVAVTVMLKNERSLANAFLRYHADMFGAQNLFVFDNGSTDPETLATLARFEAEGINLDRSFSTPSDFDSKGAIIGDLVKRLDDRGEHDFYCLLDCDEFVAMRTASGYTCSPELIHAYLDSFIGEGRVLKVGINISNIIGHPLQFRPAPYSKVIFPKDIFAGTDHGFHTGESRTGSGYLPCEIVYVHYHYRPYDELVRFAHQKLAPYLPEDMLNDRDRLRSYTGPGWHMVSYLTEGADAYYEIFKDVPNAVTFAELGERFGKLGIAIPFATVAAPRDRIILILDEASEHVVRGWALDPECPTEPVRLQFMIDGIPAHDCVCDESRPDVLASGMKSGRVGFSFKPPNRVSDGLRHFVAARTPGGTPLKLIVESKERQEVDLISRTLAPATTES